jgi:hypothetical protein
LPLAEDGRFPEAPRQFVDHLRSQGAGFSAAAMATAMAAGSNQGPPDDSNG